MDDILQPGNEGRNVVKGWTYSTPRLVVANGASTTYTINLLPDSFMVVKQLVAVSTGTFTVQFYDSSTGLLLNSLVVNNANIFGTIQLPNILLNPMVLPPSGSLTIAIANTSGAQNTIQLGFIGYRSPEALGRPVFRIAGRPTQWFQYVVNSVVAASGTTTPFIKVDADSDFIVRKLVSTQTGIYTVMITDASSADQWFDNAQSNANAIGTAQYPNILAKPKLIRANSSINIQLTDLTAAQNTIQLVFEGVKVYK
jgi:hypothetical protein